MTLRVHAVLAAACLLLAPVASQAGLTPYSQNFETLNQTSPSALSADGWLVFGNVFSPDHSAFYYGYGPFPAPNNAGGFCGLDLLPGTPPNGAQDLVVYSDYNNGDHNVGNQIEANVFQQQTIGASDVGSIWNFKFDAKLGNLVAPSTALAFIKTLDPSAGYATTNFITFNTTSIPATFSTYQISITIVPALVGQILQFGFANTATHYNGSGIFYDNVFFAPSSATPAKPESWGRLKALYR